MRLLGEDYRRRSIQPSGLVPNFRTAAFQSIDGSMNVREAILLGATTTGAGAFGVAVQTVTGKRYVLEYTDVLPGTNWIALPFVTGDGTIKVLTDPQPALHQRFYRARVE